VPEKAYLAAVDTRDNDPWSTKSSLDELERLAISAGAEVVGRMVQKLKRPERTHYLGTGKVDELLALKAEKGYDTVILTTNYRRTSS